MTARVVSVGRDGEHRFSKPPCASITLLTGLGVDGDAHAGTTVQHLSRVRADPDQPNLRQVHLVASERLAEVGTLGFTVAAGDLGENVLTAGVDLIGLPTGTLLHLGPDAVLRVTGLRNPCWQIDAFAPGLLKQMVGRDSSGEVAYRAGIMAVVAHTGVVRPGDPLDVELPPLPHAPLVRV